MNNGNSGLEALLPDSTKVFEPEVGFLDCYSQQWKIDWTQDIRMLTSVFYCNNNDINIEHRKNTNLFGWETKIMIFKFAEKIWKSSMKILWIRSLK